MLITLAIIGIVAALTIPTVVHKYQQKAYYTAFMKAYNTLQNAFTLGISEQGEPSENMDPDEFFQDYFASNLKVASRCKGNGSSCVSSNTVIKTLNGQVAEGGATLYDFVDNYPSALLQDGSLVIYNNDDAFVAVDTNGGKAPNTIGRDLFLFEVSPLRIKSGSSETEWRFYPMMLFYTGSLSPQLTLEQAIDITNIDKESEELAEGRRASCSNEPYAEGNLCAARLLLEGKMNY